MNWVASAVACRCAWVMRVLTFLWTSASVFSAAAAAPDAPSASAAMTDVSRIIVPTPCLVMASPRCRATRARWPGWRSQRLSSCPTSPRTTLHHEAKKATRTHMRCATVRMALAPLKCRMRVTPCVDAASVFRGEPQNAGSHAARNDCRALAHSTLGRCFDSERPRAVPPSALIVVKGRIPRRRLRVTRGVARRRSAPAPPRAGARHRRAPTCRRREACPAAPVGGVRALTSAATCGLKSSRMTLDWPKERVVVTGGAGFLGGFVLDELRRRGAQDLFVPRSKDYDLVDMAAVRALYRDAKPTLVLHLAAKVGGIGANRDNPGKFFYDNLMMGVQLIEVGRQVGLKKLVALGTICAYPKFCRAVQGRGSLERLSGGDERAVRHREEGAPRPERGLPAAVRDEFGRALPREPLRPARQLRPAHLPRHPGAHPEVRRGARSGRAADRRVGDGRRLARVPARAQRGRGDRRRLREVRQERGSEPRRRVRDPDPGPRAARRAPLPLRRRDRLGPDKARRPAAPHARRLEGGARVRLEGEDRVRGRAARDDRVVREAPGEVGGNRFVLRRCRARSSSLLYGKEGRRLRHAHRDRHVEGTGHDPEGDPGPLEAQAGRPDPVHREHGWDRHPSRPDPVDPRPGRDAEAEGRAAPHRRGAARGGPPRGRAERARAVIALDTNVLARLLVEDDREQTRSATALVRRA